LKEYPANNGATDETIASHLNGLPADSTLPFEKAVFLRNTGAEYMQEKPNCSYPYIVGFIQEPHIYPATPKKCIIHFLDRLMRYVATAPAMVTQTNREHACAAVTIVNRRLHALFLIYSFLIRFTEDVHELNEISMRIHGADKPVSLGVVIREGIADMDDRSELKVRGGHTRGTCYT
jgi:hypothetical protein